MGIGKAIEPSRTALGVGTHVLEVPPVSNVQDLASCPLLRNAVDAMTTHLYGSADQKTVIKRRYNFMKDLSQEQLDDLAQGKTIDLEWKLKRKRRKGRIYNQHWTNGLTTADLAAVNRFFKTEVLPYRQGSSSSTKNQLIRQLSRNDLKAIYQHNDAERERIAKMLRLQESKRATAVSKGRKKITKKL